jgi:hypothetical protein
MIEYGWKAYRVRYRAEFYNASCAPKDQYTPESGEMVVVAESVAEAVRTAQQELGHQYVGFEPTAVELLGTRVVLASAVRAT